MLRAEKVHLKIFMALKIYSKHLQTRTRLRKLDLCIKKFISARNHAGIGEMQSGCLLLSGLLLSWPSEIRDSGL